MVKLQSKGSDAKPVAHNSRAHYDYFIVERYEAGIALLGTEIKSLRAGRANIRDAYARPSDGELWLVNAHIAPYPGGNRFNHEPTRDRKLLLHRREIDDLTRKMKERGYTIVPLQIYLKHGLAKVELGLAQGKKQYDKREAIAKQESRRRMERVLKRY